MIIGLFFLLVGVSAILLGKLSGILAIQVFGYTSFTIGAVLAILVELDRS